MPSLPRLLQQPRFLPAEASVGSPNPVLQGTESLLLSQLFEIQHSVDLCKMLSLEILS